MHYSSAPRGAPCLFYSDSTVVPLSDPQTLRHDICYMSDHLTEIWTLWPETWDELKMLTERGGEDDATSVLM